MPTFSWITSQMPGLASVSAPGLINSKSGDLLDSPTEEPGEESSSLLHQDAGGTRAPAVVVLTPVLHC